MPVEVRELIIRANVVKDQAQEARSPDTTANNSVPPAQEMIEACLERMLAIQNDKTER
ncbi:MAG TPA: DUF5908 family protein [Puia sp.]|nr:DUF5908 family protein [Puia sp.]